MHKAFPIAGLLALIGAGCGSSDVPTSTMVNARASARAAEEVGAEQTPQASYHLELAKEELGHASALANDGEDAAAERMFIRARVDAELAIALAGEAHMAAEARETQQRIDTARETFVQGGAR